MHARNVLVPPFYLGVELERGTRRKRVSIEMEIKNQKEIYLNFMANLWVLNLLWRTRLPRFERGIRSSSRNLGRRVVGSEEPKRVEWKDNRVDWTRAQRGTLPNLVFFSGLGSNVRTAPGSLDSEHPSLYRGVACNM